MKEVNAISSGENYTALSLGQLSQLNEYVYHLTPDIAIPGKVFLGNLLQTAGIELSFQSFLPGQESGFLHKHKENDETYVFLKGNGQFQVDGQVFSVCEGSIIYVKPGGKRSVRNNSDEQLVVMCIQYKAICDNVEGITDGIIVEDSVVW
ncbi:MAG: cupin domain-containing protein [Marinifilaceae bacterium]